MGVVLYRIGDTHKIRGISCELKNFKPYDFQEVLNSDEGWVKTPEELYLKTEKKEESEISDEDLLGLDTPIDEKAAEALNKLSNTEIRDLAKEAGIENWKQGNLAKLKKALLELKKD